MMNKSKKIDCGIIGNKGTYQGRQDYLTMHKGWELRLLLGAISLDLYKDSKIAMSEE